MKCLPANVAIFPITFFASPVGILLKSLKNTFLGVMLKKEENYEKGGGGREGGGVALFWLEYNRSYGSQCLFQDRHRGSNSGNFVIVFPYVLMDDRQT